MFGFEEVIKIRDKAMKEAEENLNKTKEILEDIVPKEHQCNFCDSTDTIEYSAEGNSSVWLCEDCRGIGSGESADL